MVQGSSLIRPRKVTGDGEGLVSHAGIAWLAETADLAGLTAELSTAMAAVPQRRHDPGRTLAQMILALADGAMCLSDLAAIRSQQSMFGPVASDATVWRTFDQIGPVELHGIAAARAAARDRAWSAGAGPAGDDLIVDFDATLINTKADKQDARRTTNAATGITRCWQSSRSPRRSCARSCGRAMPGRTPRSITSPFWPTRSTNSLPNGVLDTTSVTTRLRWSIGVLIRADAGGASPWFADECVDRNLEYGFGFHIGHRVRDGVMCVPTGCWHPAVDAGGARRDGAEVIELTEFVDLSTWPDGTRLILRRERPHPGAQLSLFDTIEGFRHTAFITNQTSFDVAALELQRRQRARAENVIRDAKACALANLPFDDLVNNEVWMNLCFAANDLLGWAQRIGCQGQLRRATPKTIRHRMLHVAARITPNSRRLRLDQDWPWTAIVIDAIGRVRTAFQALTVTPTPSAQPAL